MFRTCGCCNVEKPISEFYRDGFGKGPGKANEPKWRRDCKECYNKARLKPKPKPIIEKKRRSRNANSANKKRS